MLLILILLLSLLLDCQSRAADEQRLKKSAANKACQAFLFGSVRARLGLQEEIFSDASQSVPYKGGYIGNLDSCKFHRADCAFAQVMAKSRRLDFSSQEHALQSGMKACNWCLPKWWKSVSAKLKLSNKN